MQRIPPGPVRGVLSLSLYVLNTVFWSIVVFSFAILKVLVPVDRWRAICGKALNGIADNWVWVNNFNQRLLTDIKWDVNIAGALQKEGWYLVIANHQSWVDILVLQKIFHRRIPFLKFFLKKELFWVPVLGQAWWALDFPFMKRYTPSFLKKHPHLKGKDFESTRKACEKFKTVPVSVMNFVEGTRFATRKNEAQRSPYTHLLKPRAGGIAFVLGAMGDQIDRIVDVTIVYPEGIKSFWDFACGKISEIRVCAKSMDIPDELLGDYAADRAFRIRFQRWLNNLWQEKDKRIARLLEEP